MRRWLLFLGIVLVWTGSVQAHGLLIPEEKALPPLAMLNHKVSITIDDQVTTTRVEQTFRNHTDRQLEATYVFPVPKGASVNKFTMWIDGKPTSGELVEADKARNIYTSIVRRTQDPGLLEYIGNNLLQMKVFPVPARGDQKVALSYSCVAVKDGNLVEYTYPLKNDGKATATLEEFSITATIKSQHGVTNVYSPTHAITLKRKSDNEVTVAFDRSQGLLDKDFQMFYSTSDKDIGLTTLTHRPLSNEKGYFSLLINPKYSIAKEYQVPRDMILVLDTSGSMRGLKMEQARNALKYCLKNLDSKDRFALINFATSVNKYRDKLQDASTEQLDNARKWVDELEATGGTAINDALAAALDYRTKDDGRSFTVVFFTDGQPTIGETNLDKIMKNTMDKNSANTRIFTFGVGDDVNATFLDQLAEKTRALSTYVRPAEDIEVKVSGLYSKISNPVLTNLKLTATNDISLSEVYPVELPDLFHGGQLVVFGRYSGKGPSAIKLTGLVGKETREFVYELTFPEKTGDDKNFVEQVWARRKVGYLLDQIRANGEKKELVDETVLLAKKYGITTPYTSWLIVPDAPVSVVGGPGKPFTPPAPPGARPQPFALEPADKGGEGKPIVKFLDEEQKDAPRGEELSRLRGTIAERELDGKGKDNKSPDGKASGDARDKKQAFDDALKALKTKELGAVQAGKLGVDLSVQVQNLRNLNRMENTALRTVQGRKCLDIGGIWVDEGFESKTARVVVKAQSDAYFRILERHALVKDVYQLGNHVVWVTPSGTVLVIDTNDGKEKLSDEEIDKLFAAKK
jgi:Ca-activated chloride channel homolog